MSTVEISEDMYRRVEEFRAVVEAVIEEEIDTDTCLEVILQQGMDSMLAELLGPQEPIILLQSIQQLASKHPAEVYQYVTETLRRGAMAQERERLRRRMGFPTLAHHESNQP